MFFIYIYIYIYCFIKSSDPSNHASLLAWDYLSKKMKHENIWCAFLPKITKLMELTQSVIFAAHTESVTLVLMGGLCV